MVKTLPEETPVLAPSPLPAGLLEAFWRCDAALLSNDQGTLNELVMPGPDTLRGDGRTVLVGHDAITGFRSGRSAIPTRKVVQLHARVVADDAALLMACTSDGDATGLQTQLWRRVAGHWVVAAAHVSLPAAPGATLSRLTAPSPIDTTIWRVVGDPLVPARAVGALDGVGVAVKDLFAVAGQPVGAGVPAWLLEQNPQVDSAPAVVALLEAGAHVVGVARTDEFAYSLAGTNAHYGSPPNPAAPGRISGGSTSGPASAVALGHAAIGLGTDTGGSIRVPASYQGLVGLRTTYGAVTTEKVLPLAPSFDTVGWLTRDVRTSVLVAEVLLPAGTTTSDVRRTLRLPTVEALIRTDLREVFASAADELAGTGALPPAETVDLPTNVLERWFHAFRTVQAWEAWQAHGRWLADHPGVLGDDVAERFRQASQVGVEQVSAARAVMGEARKQLLEWLDGSVLVIPSASSTALARSATAEEIETERGRTLRMTCLAGLAGSPAVSLPRLRSSDGYPVGICLIGAPETDRALLDIAAGVEAAA
jgi:Asp-tRNA(Asn)/Glu-tRNA(Gln) amidotransferase A subunit family amidase